MRKVGKSPGLQPGKSPPWLAKRLMRLKRLFGMAHWPWDVNWVSPKYLNAGTGCREGGPTTYGRCDPLVPYLSA